MKDEKAIKRHSKDVLMWLECVEEDMHKLNKEVDEKKRKKIEKKSIKIKV